MALHPLHGSCLFQLPLLALGMASPSNTPVYPTPPPPHPDATPRPPRFFSPDRYVAAQAQIVYYGIVSRLPMVARVTLTDYRGRILLDSFVRPTQPVCDYRTAETGLEAHHLADGTSLSALVTSAARSPVFIDVQRQVASLIRDKILVGYGLWEFLSVMGLAHPAINTRDTALFMSFRRTLGYRPNDVVPLATLVKQFMGRDIEQNGNIPVERARAALDLFRSCEHIWEEIISTGAWPCSLPPFEFRRCFT
ncbi:hypothetical protein GSI_08251 [Ganoderma sinense ZZ0214-1]|uniref:Exonuclease domain-containing protein n=1 Tax=Ganoderma sinense ZZ0214-1 TaxID=1077348 RepID=A0A2G8S7A8_9APHY|nr:hypothetical protein GSI_08251 [Ganoderma sinense ZZ0214-1]